MATRVTRDPQEKTVPAPGEAEAAPRSCAAERMMRRYQVKDLVNATPGEFRARIEQFLRWRDYQSEGYGSAERQRDLSVQFHWGHNHDFGEFALEGMTGNNHVEMISAFTEQLRVLPRSLAGRKVLDVGCWTGGTSLLLHAMGARVVAVEEVRKYVDCLAYLKHAFDLQRLEPRHLSLYDCTTPEFDDAFDYVLFCGVLYHVSDPVLALRITFNCLKDGGTCLIETAVTPAEHADLSYEGPSVVWAGSAEELNRRGWNWFIPSVTTLAQMMRDVGFAEVQVVPRTAGRAYAIGKRHAHVDMLRAGLSVRSIR